MFEDTLLESWNLLKIINFFLITFVVEHLFLVTSVVYAKAYKNRVGLVSKSILKEWDDYSTGSFVYISFGILPIIGIYISFVTYGLILGFSNLVLMALDTYLISEVAFKKIVKIERSVKFPRFRFEPHFYGFFLSPGYLLILALVLLFLIGFL